MLPMFWLGYFCQKRTEEVIDRHRRRLLIGKPLVAFAALLRFLLSEQAHHYMVSIQVGGLDQRHSGLDGP